MTTGSNVLIIDAEADFAHQLADTLQSAGLDTSIASDGKTGLDLAKNSVPAAIVVCVELPRMSGYSVCTKIRKDELLKAVPVIITSSGATPETFESHSRLSTRADEYLKKPFPPAMLLDVLRTHLRLGDPEPIDGEEIDIVDDDAFSGDLLDEEARAMETYEPGQRTAVLSVQNGQDELHDDTQDGLSSSLSGPVGVSAHDIDEDEAMTTVGRLEDIPGLMPSSPRSQPPGPSAAEAKKIERLEGELARVQRTLEEVERQRDDAITQAEAAAVRAGSSIPSVSGSSRELLDLKRDRNAKEKEILSLKEQLNEKEKELIAWRDKETELEEEIVRLQEQAERNDHLRAEAEAKAAADQRTAQQNLSELKRRLAESNSREADLDSTVQTLQSELDGMREYAGERERAEAALRGELEQARSEQEQLRSEHDDLRREHANLTEQHEGVQAKLEQTADVLRQTEDELLRTTGELERVTAEAEQTGRALADTQRELSEAREELGRTSQELDGARGEIQRLEAEGEATRKELQRVGEALKQKTSEYDRAHNELSAATAEGKSLRETVRAKDVELEDLQRRVDDLDETLASERAEREGLRGLIEEMSAERERVEGQLASAYQRMREDETIRSKALQALDIAQALLKEAGYTGAASAEAPAVEAART